jgi:phospholipid-binding lipoprotein MlaA
LQLARCAAALLSGCATTTGPANPADPLESMNRSIYSFNEGVDEPIFKPVATAYQNVTPRVARQGVTNFFDNLGDAWSFVNNVLQGQGQGAYNSMVRFSVNTVLGIGGLFDIASEAGIERRSRTSARLWVAGACPRGRIWCCPSGVLPRCGIRPAWWSMPSAILPTPWMMCAGATACSGLRMVNNRANLLKAGDVLDSLRSTNTAWCVMSICAHALAARRPAAMVASKTMMTTTPASCPRRPVSR